MRKTKIELFDDLTGERIDEANAKHVEIAYEGSTYALDLSEENFAELERVMAGYIAVAHKKPKLSTKKLSGTKRAPSAAEKKRREKIRAWAIDNDLNVGERGRISGKIIDLYEKAHAND